jgi:predicted PolB exonuclease-like 3'-5' exonuclease
MSDYQTLPLDHILFLDVETVPQCAVFDDLDPDFQHLWNKKSALFRKETETAADVYQRAGIYAEFGKIVCISVGMVRFREKVPYLRLKSFYGKDEGVILKEFTELIAKVSTHNTLWLCGHNVKEFDIPFVARRILVNGLALPEVFNVSGKKPWETSFIDTLELWKFGDYKHFTSLELLTKIFGIQSPKDDIDGSQVAQIYYESLDVERIARYCEKDVIAVVQLLLKFRGNKLIPNDLIESATPFFER